MAHSTILEARSPVFAGLFQSGMQDACDKKVELKEVSTAVVTDLVQFLYTDKTEFSNENAMALMVIADKYQVATPKK